MANPHPVSRTSKPNKASSARIDRALAQGKRLPPEDMLFLAEIYAGMASRYQPMGMASRYQPMNTNPDTGVRTPNKKHNEERYAFWLDRWGDMLAKAAPYYAPRLMAMAVQSQVQIDDKRGSLIRARSCSKSTLRC
jgi:hypothetical protein